GSYVARYRRYAARWLQRTRRRRAWSAPVQLGEHSLDVEGLCIFCAVYKIAQTGVVKGLIQPFQPSLHFRKYGRVWRNHEDRVHTIHRQKSNRRVFVGESVSGEHRPQIVDDVFGVTIFHRHYPNTFALESTCVKYIENLKQFPEITAAVADEQYVTLSHDVTAFGQVR